VILVAVGLVVVVKFPYALEVVVQEIVLHQIIAIVLQLAGVVQIAKHQLVIHNVLMELVLE